MVNFTVGPVMSEPEILEVANKSTPYFRTPEFSETIKENEKYMIELLNAPKNSRCVFLTASGTGAMESVVMNLISDKDRVIVVNGGSFGQRFVELCRLHRHNYTEIKCEFGAQLRREQLDIVRDHTVLLINMHETSSGVLYDMQMVADFCKANNIALFVDAISAFLAEEINMKQLGIGALITSSQKALAVQPGVSMIVLTQDTIKKMKSVKEKSMYLSLKEALKNGERGQTPFTPAVTTLLQINHRLKKIVKDGGAKKERERIVSIAKEFRYGIRDLPLEIVPEKQSNAVTCLRTSSNSKEIVRILKEEYDIWVCPNGGELSDSVFRVGHIGYIGHDDNLRLINALEEIHMRGVF